MIDYEKLKIAHELTTKLPFSYYSFDCLCCTSMDSGFFYTLTFEDEDNMSNEYESENIDELVEKLQELTKQKPKYQIGQTWWFLDGPSFESFPKPKSLVITEENNKWYRADEEWYPTKQSLIEAQIQYWQKMKDDIQINQHEVDADKCQHESPYIGDAGKYGGTVKCKKCGEFYK